MKFAKQVFLLLFLTSLIGGAFYSWKFLGVSGDLVGWLCFFLFLGVGTVVEQIMES